MLPSLASSFVIAHVAMIYTKQKEENLESCMSF